METKMKYIIYQTMLVIMLIEAIGFAGLSDGLVGYWSFDDLSDPGHDDSGNGNFGTVVGANSTPGKVGNALNFDGVDDYVQVVDSEELDLTSSFTLSFWINPSSGNESILIAKHLSHTDNDGSWAILHPSNSDPYFGGSLVMYNWLSSPDYVSSVTQIQQDTWAHWSITYDATTTTCIFYTDGQVDVIHDYTFDIRNTSRDIFIGAGEHFEVPVTYFYEGMIDEVRIYNRALSAEEVSQIYNLPSIEPIEAEHCGVFPPVIHRYRGASEILAVLRLPEGITKDQVALDEPLVLYPGEIEADRQNAIQWYKRRKVYTSVYAFFDKDALMAVVPDDGRIELEVVGQLDSGQYFYGIDTVRIISRGRWFSWWDFFDDF